ncbi:MAG: ABC transporter ATP-binding protein [Bacillales bacterium]
MNEIIKIENGSRYYKNGLNNTLKVLDNLSFSINEGDYIAITGVSGSGKSTLLNIIGCLDRLTSGNIYFKNKEITKSNDNDLCIIRGNDIGYILQDFSLIENYKAKDNVIIPLFLSKKFKNNKDKKNKVEEVLNKVGLKDKINTKIKYLSGGQKQRVAIARAIVNDPIVILADEPTSSLDKNTKLEIMELFNKLNNEGITIIMVTHDDEVAKYAKKILKIEDGKLV